MHKISKQGDIDLELDETLVGQKSEDLEAALHQIRNGTAKAKPRQKIAPSATGEAFDLDKTIVGESPDIAEALANIRRQRQSTKTESSNRPKRAHKLDFVLTENHPAVTQRRPQNKPLKKPAGKNLSVGQTLAYQRYTIKAFLSQDRVSELYLARDSRRGENIAIRVLNPNISDADKVTFFHTAQRAIELQHEDIVHIYDAQHEQNLTYVSMEISQGQSLRKLIAQRQKQNSPFHEAEVLEIINPLCHALSYVHQQGGHGDISPKNIWIDSHNRSKLSGFAHLNDSNSKNAHYYKAPEQKLNSATATSQSDQYSLAAMVYEMLTGTPPREITAPLQNIRPDLSPHFCDAIDKALKPQGMQRFKEVKAFKNALNGAKKQNSKSSDNSTPNRKLTPILIGIIAVLCLTVAAMLVL